MSILKTRFRRCAQLIEARRSAEVRSCGSSTALGLLPLPRFADVTDARCLLFGANTPWNLIRLTRGLGTSAARRAMKSSGSKMTCVVPSRYGVFNWSHTLPLGVSDRRFSEIAGLEIYRHKRSSFLRSSALAAIPACRLNSATFPAPPSPGSSLAGRVYKVNTSRPACGPTAMRYVMECPSSGVIGSSPTESVAR